MPSEHSLLVGASGRCSPYDKKPEPEGRGHAPGVPGRPVTSDSTSPPSLSRSSRHKWAPEELSLEKASSPANGSLEGPSGKQSGRRSNRHFWSQPAQTWLWPNLKKASLPQRNRSKHLIIKQSLRLHFSSHLPPGHSSQVPLCSEQPAKLFTAIL